MTEHDILPQNEFQLLDWLTNFSNVFPEIGSLLGITQAEISALNALVLSVINDIRSGKSEEKRIQKESMVSFLLSMVRRMKNHPSYNKEFGKKLRIE